MVYLVTSIAGSIEGLVATYTLKPAWGEIASTPVTVEPAHAAFDARPMITLTNEAFVPAYYNASTAASVSLRFARAAPHLPPPAPLGFALALAHMNAGNPCRIGRP